MQPDIENQFETPLGIIICGVQVSASATFIESKHYSKGSSKVYSVPGHQIEFISFKLSLQVPNGETVTDAAGWIVRIEKVTEEDVMLQAYCRITTAKPVELFKETAEHSDSINVVSKEWTLHIATENAEVLNARAEHGNWFPKRLLSETTFTSSVVDGFATNVPALRLGEQLHLHYLVAYDVNREGNINTWLATDVLIAELENWIGLSIS